jgi:hypothetical protein
MKSEYRIRETKGSWNDRLPSIFVLLLAGLLLGGCDDCKDKVVYETVVVVDNLPPSAPDGLVSITGDEVVYLQWNPNQEPDLAGYVVYYNYDGSLRYTFLADVPKDEYWYYDTDVQNGVTKFYAVLAYDIEGLESDLSYEDVFDTPRPEGTDLVLKDYLQDSDFSGYDFSRLPYGEHTQAWDDPETDIYFGTPNGELLLFAHGTGVDLQDYGYADAFDEVGWAPTKGWAQGKVALIPGHIYIVRIQNKTTGLYNYAKIRVTDLAINYVQLDWAYQTDPSNPELTPGR